MNASLKKEYDYVVDALNKHPQLVHASKLMRQFDACKDNKKKKALNRILPEYYKYLNCVLSVENCTQKNVRKMTDALNVYYDFLHENKYDNIFSSQSKFRPTILEEFIFLLFLPYISMFMKEHPEVKSLDSGNVKAYSNLYFNAADFKAFVTNPKIAVNDKEQDYAIFSSITVTLNGKSETLQVPALAVEVKTYLDKTMLDSIIATAEKIKNGNPHARFITVVESYEVGEGVDPSYSRIDQIYVLRKKSKREDWAKVDADVVWDLYSEAKVHLERPWSDIKAKVRSEGKVL